MAKDYPSGESVEYVRGTLEDAIIECSAGNKCSMCGAVIDNQVGCHYQCRRCGNHETCSD